VDHVEFYVSNAEKSRDFYTRVFGRTLLIRGNKRYLKVGGSYLAFEPATGSAVAGQVDHVSVAVNQMDMAALHKELEQRGVRYQDYPSGRDTAVLDPDGARLQLSPKGGWSFLTPPGFSPEVVQATEPPIFDAGGVSSVTIRCSDIAKALEFYRKVFGQEPRDSGADLLLVPAQPGERPGVSEIAIVVKVLKEADAVRQLTNIGAKVIASRPNGSGAGYVSFSDPDGLRILAHTIEG
jgi:catechol 2,3-dioxygenase-like lactoylglutathione lyase family enzyme